MTARIPCVSLVVASSLRSISIIGRDALLHHVYSTLTAHKAAILDPSLTSPAGIAIRSSAASLWAVEHHRRRPLNSLRVALDQSKVSAQQMALVSSRDISRSEKPRSIGPHSLFNPWTRFRQSAITKRFAYYQITITQVDFRHGSRLLIVRAVIVRDNLMRPSLNSFWTP